MKPLHERGFAGMLPRTMSQGNDAFTSKDAATDTSAQSDAQATKAQETKAEPSASDSGVRTEGTSSERSVKDESRGDERDERDERDEDDDRDREESSREAKERSGGSRRSGKPRRSRRDEDDEDDDRPAPPQTEEALDVPKKSTIYMLGAMSALTVVLWFMAKLSCNVHPDQMRDPKHFSTRDLAADPKNAAFEFHHKFEIGDYVTAVDLATGEMKRTVEAKLGECEQNVDSCIEKSKKLAGSIESTARVMDRSANRATVEITSVYKAGLGTKDFSFDVVKEGEFWRVASRREMAPAPAQQVPAATETAPAATAPAAPAAPAEMSDQSSSER